MRRISKVLALWVAVSACGGGSTPTPMGDAGSLAGVGGSCATDVDCRSGLTCFRGAEGARPWPSGYCTRACTMEDCPTGSRCGEAYTDASGATVTMCLQACTRTAGSTGGCRAGYQCMYDGACHVGCTTDAQCTSVDFDQGTPASHPGSTCEVASGRCIRGGTSGGGSAATCTTDADCRGPSGACLGGTCYRGNCDLGGAYACDAGEQCYAFAVNTFQVISFCGRECTVGTDGLPGSPGVCRASEACLPQEADLLDHATHAYCAATGGAGIVGNASAHFGGACTTTRDCPNPLGYSTCTGGVCQEPYCAAASIASMHICGASADCLPLPTTDSPDRAVRHAGPLGFCFGHCTTSTDCAGGLTCNAGLCTP